MNPNTTQPYTNQLTLRMLQCLHGIRTWYPQASGDRILPFFNRYYADFEETFKPACPSNWLNLQVKQTFEAYSRQIAHITIMHYKKRISDYVQQLCFIRPPNYQIQKAISFASTKGKERWGEKLHPSVISELTEICYNYFHHNHRDNLYKEAHKKQFGLTCHVFQYKDYTSPFPADPNDPSKVIVKSYENYGNSLRDVRIIRNSETINRQHPYMRRNVQPHIVSKSTTQPHDLHTYNLVSKEVVPKTTLKEPVVSVIPNRIISELDNQMLLNSPVVYSPLSGSNICENSSLVTKTRHFSEGSIAETLDDLLENKTPERRTLQYTPSQFTPSNTPAQSTQRWEISKLRTAPKVKLIHNPDTTSHEEQSVVITEPTSYGSSLPQTSINFTSSPDSDNPLENTMENYPLPQRASQTTRK